MTALYIALSIAAVLLLLYLFLIFPSLRRHPDRTILSGLYIAHRGLHDLFENTPENSLAAFREAVRLGLAIEIDIHLTADGRVVVFHDNDLRRMCGVDGTVEAQTLAQLKTYRLNGTDQRIPTLEECLEVIGGRVPLLIEFKCGFGNWKALCEAANTILRNYTGHYLVQSFFPLAMWWYRRHRRDICRGQLSSAFPGEPFLQVLLGKLLFNFLSRPDFVSYDHQFANSFSLKLNVTLGAFPVGWTFTSQADLDADQKRYKTYIFETFLPRDMEQSPKHSAI